MKAPPLDVQAAIRVAPALALTDVLCVAIGAVFLQDRDAPPDWSLAWRHQPFLGLWQRLHQEIVAIFPFTINVELKSPDDSESPIRVADVQATWRLHYAVQQGVDIYDPDIEDFVGVNAFLHAWPYLRAEVQSLTTKVGLPALVLPLQFSGNAAQNVTVMHTSEVPGGGGADPGNLARSLPS